MAAQAYYQGSSTSEQVSVPPSAAPQPPSGPPPGRGPSALQVPGNPPYPLYDGPPPPYSPGERASSQPPPVRPVSRDEYQDKPVQQQRPPQPQSQQAPPRQQQQQQPSPRPGSYPPLAYDQQPRPAPTAQADYDAQFRPPVRQQHNYAYADEKRNGSQQQGYQQGYYGAQPVQPPYTSGNNVAFAPTPQYQQYQQYPPRERSRSRSRERRKHHPQPKKKSGLNTFLGAGGGALIGDAIFPGLGTIGGALLGGFGGHEYDKQKSKDNKHRERRYSNDYDYRSSRK